MLNTLHEIHGPKQPCCNGLSVREVGELVEDPEPVEVDEVPELVEDPEPVEGAEEANREGGVRNRSEIRSQSDE
jgi:hypothetical protein